MAKRKNFSLRMDPDLYNFLENCAEDELRSANTQGEMILKEAAKKQVD